MANKIKSFFFNFTKMPKPTVLGGILVLIILGASLPLHFAGAIPFGDQIASGFIYVIGYALQIIASVTGLILMGAGWALNFATTSLSNVPYTKLTLPGGGDTIVGIGWPIVRDLVNMLFVIILIVIGLSTALRLKERGAQKILPALILIALLINFTPVICGLIVDASNITMGFFLSAFQGENNGIGSIFANRWDAQGKTLKIKENPGTMMASGSLVANTFVLILFDILASGILMAFAFLFIARHIAIWVLVILSPIAFACYILPDTKKIWKAWWNQFFQWCIVGIVASFFLYLSSQMMALFENEETSIFECTTTNLSGVEGLFCQTMPSMIALIFLFIGFLVSVNSGAIGASFASRVGRTVGWRTSRIATGWAGKGVMKGAEFPVKVRKGIQQYKRRRKLEASEAGQITRGIRRPMPPGLTLEEGLEAETMRQQSYKKPSKIKTGMKEFGRAMSYGLGLEGHGRYTSKQKAKASWGLLKALAVKDVNVIPTETNEALKKIEIIQTIKKEAKAGLTSEIGKFAKQGGKSPEKKKKARKLTEKEKEKGEIEEETTT